MREVMHTQLQTTLHTHRTSRKVGAARYSLCGCAFASYTCVGFQMHSYAYALTRADGCCACSVTIGVPP